MAAAQPHSVEAHATQLPGSLAEADEDAVGALRRHYGTLAQADAYPLGVPSGRILAVVTALAVLLTTVAAHGATPPRPAIHALPANLPTLRNAVALGTLIALDPHAHAAEFRVTCGWFFHPKHRARPGLWKVDLGGLAFEWESYPDGPASEINHTESFASWRRRAEQSGWSGTLYLSRSNGFLTDGPTTDICAGVLG